MPSRHALTISLTPELARFVAGEVGSGRYGSASEVVRAGLRLLLVDVGAGAGTHAGRNAGEPSGAAPRRVGARAMRAAATARGPGHE